MTEVPQQPDSQQDPTPKPRRWRMHIAALVVMLLITAVGVEVAARVVYRYKDRVIATIPGLMDLHEYQERDTRYPYHYRLRPGFVESFQEAAEASKRARRILGEKFINETRKTKNIPEDEVFVRINSDGFRGPEIDKKHSRFRILTIGDSITFGTSEVHNYSRSLERHLRELGRDTEVINGGVEGYSPRNVLLRIEEYKALQPQITTVYIGWNALYNERNSPASQMSGPLYSPRMLALAFSALPQFFGDRQKAALAAYSRPKNPDPTAVELDRLKAYVPWFVEDVERIADALEGDGRQVVLLTLPGLFATDEAPTARALEVGHLPRFTDNPYFLAGMAAKYNDALRRLATRKQIPLIDLEAWSKTALQPRDKYFFDSVHLYDEGQELIGAYMAEELRHRISEQ